MIFYFNNAGAVKENYCVFFLTFLRKCDIIILENKKGNGFMKIFKYFICPHCHRQLTNQNAYMKCDNENEFWCDCGRTYIVEEDGSYIVEGES